MRTPDTIAPTPEAPRITPRTSASPPSSLRTMNGSSTSNGPRNSSSVSAADSSVAPQPRLRAHEPRPLADVLEDRRPRVLARHGQGPHQSDADHRDHEGARVDGEGSAGSQCRHQQAADRRACEAERDGLRELLERVRLDQEPLRDHVRHDGLEVGGEDRLAHAVEDGEGDHVPQLDDAGEREDGDRRDRDRPDRVTGDHQPPPVEAVAEHAADEQEDDHRQRPRDAHGGERRGDVREVVDLPGEGNDVDAVAEERDRRPAEQQREVADPQRAQDPDAALADRSGRRLDR